jgi:hypothetical protein
MKDQADLGFSIIAYENQKEIRKKIQIFYDTFFIL